MTDKKTRSKAPAEKAKVAPSRPVELNEKDLALREALRERVQAFPRRPRSTVEMNDGLLQISPHPDEDGKFYAAGTYAAVGSESTDFLNTILDDVVRAVRPDRGITEQGYNAALAVLAAVEPRNEVEALLAGQMIAANAGAMDCARRMASAKYIEHASTYGGLANKFMRTFTAQMEALSKLRRGGEQVIKYVHVHEGGQAVIGSTINQHQGGGVKDETGQCHGQATDARLAALSGPDPARDGMPIPGNAERAMSYARRDESGGAEGE